jgi:hypothetical protein
MEKGLIGFQTIPSMSKVIICGWFFYILLRGQILGDVPFNRNLHIPSFTLQKLKDMSMGMYAISIITLFWPPCLNPSFHTKSTLEKGDFARFSISMDWDNGVMSQPHFEGSVRSSLTLSKMGVWNPPGLPKT